MDMTDRSFPGVQDRPCTRCIKRNIGHLCHDEPREPTKRSRSDHEHSNAEEESSSATELGNVQGMQDTAAGQQILTDAGLNANSAPSVPNLTASPGQGLLSNSQQRKPQAALPIFIYLYSATTDVKYFNNLQFSDTTTGLADKVSFKICILSTPPTCSTLQKSQTSITCSVTS